MYYRYPPLRILIIHTQVVTIEKTAVPGGHLKSQKGASYEYAFDQVFGPSVRM